MAQILSNLGFALALCALTLLPGASFAQKDTRVRHVQDDANLFTQAARDKANQTIAKIAQKAKKELIIETVLKGPANKDAAAQWSRERFNNYKSDGVYIVFSVDPKVYQIRVGDKTRSQGYFTNDNIARVQEIIKTAGSNDERLDQIVTYVADTMIAHAPRQGGGEPAAKAAPVKKRPPVADNESAMPAWVGWLCVIAVVGLVIWVIFALIRAVAMPAGGYGYGPGYGGGGGFFSGFLGGLFGAAAGMWMYNSFFGGHSHYGGGGDLGASNPVDAGGDAYKGDTDTDAGAGGEWGGDDDKAAGWGGDAGGGDDAGGGGDWGGDAGGGDAGGGDAGGGDWGGGGGADFGGGGCGGGGGGGDW